MKEVALSMWEELGYRQIDSSVLSRVLNGERLFTPGQLAAFTKTLQLSKKQKTYLYYCLQKDYLRSVDINDDTLILSYTALFERIEGLLEYVKSLLYEGKCTNAVKASTSINSFIEMLNNTAQTDTQRQRLQEFFGWNLYLLGRSIGSMSSSYSALSDIVDIVRKLGKLNKEYKLMSFEAYRQNLLADAYYISGGYVSSKSKQKYYKRSILAAKKAISLFPSIHHEKFFALRTLAASANYLSDYDAIAYVNKILTTSLPRQPLENKVNILHLSGTLAKSSAIMKKRNPFAVKETVEKYFDSNLSGTGIYELSDKKTTIEILVLLQSDEKKYMRSLTKKALQLAYQDNFSRHRDYLHTLAESI